MRLFFLSMLLLVLASCKQTPTEKARSAVERYMKANVDDPSSYDPISFYVDTPRIARYNGQIVADMPDTSFAAWQVEHKYRAKNKFGAVVISEAVFYLDRDFTIKKVEDR